MLVPEIPRIPRVHIASTRSDRALAISCKTGIKPGWPTQSLLLSTTGLKTTLMLEIIPRLRHFPLPAKTHSICY